MRPTQHNFDFHCHSTASDGSLPPAELLELALSYRLEYWSLTDHDTIEGYRSLLNHPRVNELQLIPGVELTCDWSKQTMHILAFGFDADNSGFNVFLGKQKDRRKERAFKIAEKIERHFKVSGMYSAASLVASSDAPARPHFAAVMEAQGLVESTAEAFNKYLGAGKWGDVKLYWPDLEELMAAVDAASAVAVVAHPFHYKMTAAKMRRLMDDFQALGGQGMEVGVPNINSGQHGWLTDEMRKRNMLQSGGSDFHGATTPWSHLGRFPKLSKDLPVLFDMVSV